MIHRQNNIGAVAPKTRYSYFSNIAIVIWDFLPPVPIALSSFHVYDSKNYRQNLFALYIVYFFLLISALLLYKQEKKQRSYNKNKAKKMKSNIGSNRRKKRQKYFAFGVLPILFPPTII